MKKRYLIYALACLSACGQAKNYDAAINEHRMAYKQGFLTDERAPLTAADTGYLRFYEPDEAYKVTARFERTPNTLPFNIPTVSGKTKEYQQYGTATFTINDTTVTLHIYQSVKLRQMKEYSDHLFIPFTDATTGFDTYGGGRYLDISTKDLNGNEVVLDFNKCYNPWCAFADGYSCPIPPRENFLKVAIKAGEKNYAKNIH